MPHTTGQGLTLATCCYCGAKGALCLRTLSKRDGRRELTCQSCGAPLRALKQVKAAAPAPRPAPKPAATRTAPEAARRGPPPRKGALKTRPPKIRPPKRPKRRSWVARVSNLVEDAFDEAFELIEDALD